MAASCSFIFETETEKFTKQNDVCYAALWRHRWQNGKPVKKEVKYCKLIIESEKYYKSKEKTLEFLEDLQNMGFRCRIMPKDQSIEIVPLFKVKRNPKNIWFLQSVRALWESKYDESGKFEQYTDLIDMYFELKDMNLPYNELEIFALAHSCLEITGKSDNWGRGHYSVNLGKICRIPNLHSMAMQKQSCLQSLSMEYPPNWKGKKLTEDFIKEIYEYTCQK